jgi:hypothetical protein
MNKASEKFYNDLQDNINKISTDDMIIVMDDLNVGVEGVQYQPTLNSYTGPVTIDTVNENGTRLMDFLCY